MFHCTRLKLCLLPVGSKLIYYKVLSRLTTGPTIACPRHTVYSLDKVSSTVTTLPQTQKCESTQQLPFRCSNFIAS
uniref:Uncharacterized protein n=1 Tax=Arundo donax TaxID=35708 RepID=A0A0A8XRX2_ARUDO